MRGTANKALRFTQLHLENWRNFTQVNVDLQRRVFLVGPNAVRFIPQMFARIQRRSGRQVLVSMHSSDLLRDDGIGLDEVLLLLPTEEGTLVQPAADFGEIQELLQGGSSLAEAVFPLTTWSPARAVAALLDLPTPRD